MKVIETERLILRTWNESDAEAYFVINQDPKVLDFLSGPLTMDVVKQSIADKNQCFALSVLSLNHRFSEHVLYRVNRYSFSIFA